MARGLGPGGSGRGTGGRDVASLGLKSLERRLTPNDVDARTYDNGSYPQSLPAGADEAYAFDRCFGTKS